MSEIKYMDIEEFRSMGYIQEINRQFLHPRGLALELRYNENREIEIGGVWDFRDDPEGLQYAPAVLNREIAKEKAHTVQAELDKRVETRMEKFGYIIQPMDIE